MNAADILFGLEAALAGRLKDELGLRLTVAENPEAALNALQNTPQGGLVVLSWAEDDSQPGMKGGATVAELQVLVAAARGLGMGRGEDLYKERPNGRAAYLKLFADVVTLFRRVQFVNAAGEAHEQFPCLPPRYLGSFWFVGGDESMPVRDRVARFEIRYAFDAAGDRLTVEMPDAR